MWRSLLTSLVRPKKVTFAWGNGSCPLRNQRSGSNYARWTADEDRKLIELRQQGLQFSQITDIMSNRTLAALVARFNILKPGKIVRPQPRANAIVRHWSPQEEELMLEMLQQGLTRADMMNRLPGRTYNSIRCHLAARETWTPGHRQKNRIYKDAEIQRMIHMRLKEARSFKEIALEFKVHQRSVSEAWYSRCLPLVSEEAREMIRLQRIWSPKEIDHLLRLHRKGTLTTREAALQFPSKSMRQVQSYCARRMLKFPRCSKKPKARIFRRPKRVKHSTADSEAQAKSLGPQEDESEEA